MRALLFAFAVVLAAGPACGGHRDEVIDPGGPPPLPPASGSVIGYLLDAQHDLALRDDQISKLEKLDNSLAARNGQIDAQLRMIEKPVPAEEMSPQQMKAGEAAPRYNNAPGASTVGTDDSRKLHQMRDDNDRDAIKQAMAVLDADQQAKARRILQDRGVVLPGEKTTRATGSGEP
jgi:hypothetical protein